MKSFATCLISCMEKGVDNFLEKLSEDDAFLLLNGVKGLGPISIRRLLERFQDDPVAVLRASKNELMQVRGVGEGSADSIRNEENPDWLEKEKGRIKKRGIDFITQTQLPPLLREIYDCPIGLYVLGALPPGPYVSIVGTRMPSNYGKRVCQELAFVLAQRGFCIVSGMARGIDAVAHQGALEAKGKTVAFLGSGLDVIYPPEHTDLYRKISETGAVLSEFPLGRKADRRTFPMRNRLVSGISSGVIVVESASSGGSLITAKLAADQGRMVLAVPGRVDQASASGCNQLIRDGATLVRNADDVMEEIEPSLSAIERQVKPLGEQLEHSPEHGSDASISEEESKLIKAFEEGDYLSMEELGEITSLEASKLSSNLTMLELNGLICKRSDGRFEAL